MNIKEKINDYLNEGTEEKNLKQILDGIADKWFRDIENNDPSVEVVLNEILQLKAILIKEVVNYCTKNKLDCNKYKKDLNDILEKTINKIKKEKQIEKIDFDNEPELEYFSERVAKSFIKLIIDYFNKK